MMDIEKSHYSAAQFRLTTNGPQMTIDKPELLYNIYDKCIQSQIINNQILFPDWTTKDTQFTYILLAELYMLALIMPILR
jgi:hypothetical protein